MNFHELIRLFLATENPVLPDPILLRMALYVSWATVMGVGVFWATARLSLSYRLGFSLLVMLWALVPGSLSPTYWLALAFQAPSLMTVVLCWLGVFWSVRRLPAIDSNRAALQARPLRAAPALGIVLGWVLLLDTLAWMPVSVYAWGFSPVALAVVLGLVAIFWIFETPFGPEKAPCKAHFSIVLGVLAFFVLTRLPTGNVWDALLDPWLWLVLQLVAVRNGRPRWRGQSAPLFSEMAQKILANKALPGSPKHPL